MSMRWKIMGMPLGEFNHADTAGEPFAAIQLKRGGTIVLTKEQYFSEDDEQQSSVHHQQEERERG